MLLLDCGCHFQQQAMHTFTRIFYAMLLVSIAFTTRAQVPNIHQQRPDTAITTATKDTNAAQKFLPDPKKAVRVALIPGGGQLYNRDYWKLPIVYLSVGGGVFTYYLNTLKYHDFLRAYKSFY